MNTPVKALGSSGEASSKKAGEATSARKAGQPLVSMGSPILKDIQVTLQAGLGEVSLSMEELMALGSGSVIKLDMKLTDLVELRLNQSLIARGEIVAVDDNFGVRIIEISQAS